MAGNGDTSIRRHVYVGSSRYCSASSAIVPIPFLGKIASVGSACELLYAHGCTRSNIAHQSISVLSLSLHTPAKPSNLLISQASSPGCSSRTFSAVDKLAF